MFARGRDLESSASKFRKAREENKVRKLDYFSFVPRRRLRNLDVRPKRSRKFSQQIWKR